MTTKLLVQVYKQDQAKLAARHNGTEDEPPRSRWVIARLRLYLPPDHRHLAERLLDLRAQSLGYATACDEMIDGARNGTAISADGRADALRTLYGYAAAVQSRIGHANAKKCFWGIATGDAYEDVAHAVGYRDGRGGYRTLFVKLVQLVMIRAQEYSDEITPPRKICA